jgi:uncharacterized protein (DUF1778 family)
MCDVGRGQYWRQENLKCCREAETVLLDTRYFALTDEAFRRFTAMLDEPPASNPRLARLLKTRASWDK